MLLDFWASWCVPCLEELPLLKKIYTDYNPSHIVFISVSIDEKKQDWLKMEEKNIIPWTSLLSDSVVAKKYDINSVPNKILIDKKGKIVGSDLSLGELYKKIIHLNN